MYYKFTGEKRKIDGVTVRRIQRYSDGLLGGWLERYQNLSQEDDCFVYDDACVFGVAQVQRAAVVRGAARVYGHTIISNAAVVEGHATVSGYSNIEQHAYVGGYADVRHARVSGHAQVYDRAVISGIFESFAWAPPQIGGNAQVYGTAQVLGSVIITDRARVCGTAVVCNCVLVWQDAYINYGTYHDGDITVDLSEQLMDITIPRRQRLLL